jgi:hypothetical protein
VRALLLVLALAAAAFADVTRPAYLGLAETRPGRFEVVWRVPRRGDRVLAIRAVLPEVLREVTSPTVHLEVDVQTARWTVEAEPWELPGSVIRVEGPGAARVDTMVRFEFQDGMVVTRILPPGTTECRFPRRAAARSPAREISGATLAGLRHTLFGVAHLVFLFGLALSGRVRIAAGALAFFLLGQLGGIALGPPIPAPVVHALLGVAGAVAARAALRTEPRGLGPVALLCGVAHGAVLAAEQPGGWLPLFGAAVGIDAGGLALALVATVIVRARWKTVACYAVGTAAVALALFEATSPDPTRAEDPQPSILMAPAAGLDTPASAPVAAATDAPLQLFVEVTPFETRVEWVAQVAALGVAEGGEIAVREQDALKQRIRELFERRLGVTLDQEPATAAGTRVDFVTREAGGILERVQPVVEPMEAALVGVAHSFPTRAPPGRVVVRWEPLPGAESVPAVIVDPQNTLTTSLDAARPELVWSDALAMPPVREVAVREETVDLSLLSLGLIVLGLIGAVRWFRRGGVVGARLLLAGACLTAPYVRVPIPLPGGSTPGTEQAAEVVEALLTNIYRSLEQQDESAAYDRLGLSVTEAALGPIYLEQRRLLELGRRGGARARVDSVEVTRVDGIEPLDGGRFGATVAWEAGGFVVHYGHRHFRQNGYEAEVELIPEDGAWRIGRLEVLEKQRTR